MHLIKFKLENGSEPYSIYACLNDEIIKFKRTVEIIKKEHDNEEVSIAVKNEVCKFKNIDELLERCEMIELSHDEYQLLGKLRIGNNECTAKYLFDAVCDQNIVFEPKDTMEMEM